MKSNSKIWIGADPGGKGKFGLAILGPESFATICCVGCAEEAVDVVLQHVTCAPAGIGVDAPLWWSSGKSGDRCADQWIRKQYCEHGLRGGTVQAANSLRGAALVQGMMFVQRMREHFPKVPVTETHPKAQLFALGNPSWKSFTQSFSVTCRKPNEHERDAIISAVAAREGFEKRWKRDLSKEPKRHDCEQDPKNFWLAPVHYFWPE